MMKEPQSFLRGGCVALFLVVFAVCALGGVLAEAPEQVNFFRQLAQKRGRARAPSESELQSIRQIAEAGNAKAQFVLGGIYSHGMGVAQDDAAAAKWFRRAAEQGDAEAQSVLGGMFFNGQGVERNYTEGAKWFRRAAEQGHGKAEFLLGGRYYNGEGVARDYAAAAEWFRRAAGHGHSDAQFVLGYMHYTGQGVTQNYRRAYVWFSIAAAAGNEEAIKLRDSLAALLPAVELSAAQAESAQMHADIQRKQEAKKSGE